MPETSGKYSVSDVKEGYHLLILLELTIVHVRHHPSRHAHLVWGHLRHSCSEKVFINENCCELSHLH